MKKALMNFCLQMGDNNLILGQQLAAWCSRGPILEEDLALTNLSLDHFGQAEMFFNYYAELEGKGRTADDVAFLREERAFKNNLLVEQPNGDFAATLLRQYLYSAFAHLLYSGMKMSEDLRLSAIAEKADKETNYHIKHSADWLIRMGNGTEESKRRLVYALKELWMFSEDLFLENEDTEELFEMKAIPSLSALKALWELEVKELFQEAGLNIPEHSHMIKGGITGYHTEHLGHLLCEMQFLQRAYPGAKW
jgi:ring-1,2-phenylacetyl-CoA epoxidase subunit PaaC